MAENRFGRMPCVAVGVCAAILSGCQSMPDSNRPVRAGSQELAFSEARFSDAVAELEEMVLPPQRIEDGERHRLRGSLEFLVRYLDARSPSQEKIVVLRRRLVSLRTLRSGVVDATPGTYADEQATLDHLEARILEAIRRLSRDDDTADSTAADIEPLAAAPSSGGTHPRPRMPADAVATIETMVLPPGRLDVGTKQRLRPRLDNLLAFLETPPLQEEPDVALRKQLDRLTRFGRVGPVDGSHELYERYKTAIEVEERRLRDRLDRMSD